MSLLFSDLLENVEEDEARVKESRQMIEEKYAQEIEEKYGLDSVGQDYRDQDMLPFLSDVI